MNRRIKNSWRRKRNRRFIGITFKCCRVYTRIYKNRLGDAYEGWCPKCGATVRVKIGRNGTDKRFFIAV